MESRILFNFATKSRAERFFNCLDNIRQMSESASYFVAVKIDPDDKCDYSRLKEYPEAIHVVKEPSRGKIHAINRNIPDGWDILVNMSDDVKWVTKGFDNIIREQMEEDTFLHFPEDYADNQAEIKNRETICVVSIMDKKYYDRFNYVYHPDYISLWCDNEATEVARRLGRYKFVNKKLFEHLHPAAGKAEMDRQYKHTESFYWRDKKTFERRNAKNFDL